MVVHACCASWLEALSRSQVPPLNLPEIVSRHNLCFLAIDQYEQHATGLACRCRCECDQHIDVKSEICSKVSFSTKSAGPLLVLMTNSLCALCGCFLARCVYGARLEYRQVPTGLLIRYPRYLIIPTRPGLTDHSGPLPCISGLSNITIAKTKFKPYLILRYSKNCKLLRQPSNDKHIISRCGRCGAVTAYLKPFFNIPNACL